MNKKLLKNFLYALSLLIFAVFHLSFLPNFNWWDGKFNLIFLLIVFIVLKDGLPGLIWATISGIILDSFSGGTFLIFTVAFLIAALIVYLLHKKVFSNINVLTITVMVLVFTFIVFVIIAVFDFSHIKDLSLMMLWQFLFNSIISIISFIFITYFVKKFSKRYFISYG